MSNCKNRNVISITQGSREKVLVRLTDPNIGERFDLSAFESGKAQFKTSAGEEIEIEIPFPISDPKLGTVEFTIHSVDTQKFDCEMKDFQLVFKYTGSADEHIEVLENILEVKERTI